MHKIAPLARMSRYRGEIGLLSDGQVEVGRPLPTLFTLRSLDSPVVWCRPDRRAWRPRRRL